MTICTNSYQQDRTLLKKLNFCFVQIIKQEWPRHWETFVPEIVQSSTTSEAVCVNNLHILQLLSEEVFDFSSGELTTAKANSLKQSFKKEFGLIFDLCLSILEKCETFNLLSTTLDTLLRFLNWIPSNYIFQSKFLDILCVRLLPEVTLMDVVIQCLTEISSHTLQDANNSALIFKHIFASVISRMRTILPRDIDIAAIFRNGSQERDQTVIRHLAVFLTTFLRAHRREVEAQETAQDVLDAHEYLVMFSRVADDDMFKMCVEYWHNLGADLYNESRSQAAMAAQSGPSGSAQSAASCPLMLAGTSMAVAGSVELAATPRKAFYAKVLSETREVLVTRFAKPEEVLITEDENGEVVREYVKDTEGTALYALMKETLVYLTHLDYADTQRIMIQKLQQQVTSQNWSRSELNSLSWAVGSISGAIAEELERKFVVIVIRDLLGLVEVKRGKDNKAAIAGNIMYVVGQYPRFLRMHWKFLKTVVNKLFEFMHEKHPGVQDMAVDTFLKIAAKCKKKFVLVNTGDVRPYVDDILSNVASITCDLEPGQQNTFYAALATIIAAQSDPATRTDLVSRLMELPNQAWSQVVTAGMADVSTLRAIDTVRILGNILRANTHAAGPLRSAYTPQLTRIYVDMLNLYKFYSSEVAAAIRGGNQYTAGTAIVKYMRGVKQEILNLIETYVAGSADQDTKVVAQNFVSGLVDVILPDYAACPPAARDPQVLSLMTTVVNRMKEVMTPEIPHLFGYVFESTLELITKNFVDYPDHRRHFFALIEAVNTHCFSAFFALSDLAFKLVMDSIVWAFKHTDRGVADTGLKILADMLRNIATNQQAANGFYARFYKPLIQDLFGVLTDTFHKAEFKRQAEILKHLFDVVGKGFCTIPLWDQQSGAENQANGAVKASYTSNQAWLNDFLGALAMSSFPNLVPQQVSSYLSVLLNPAKDINAFKNCLRDFLISIKEFSDGSDNTDLYLEEKEAADEAARKRDMERKAAIPGMFKPSEISEMII